MRQDGSASEGEAVEDEGPEDEYLTIETPNTNYRVTPTRQAAGCQQPRRRKRQKRMVPTPRAQLRPPQPDPISSYGAQMLPLPGSPRPNHSAQVPKGQQTQAQNQHEAVEHNPPPLASSTIDQLQSRESPSNPTTHASWSASPGIANRENTPDDSLGEAEDVKMDGQEEHQCRLDSQTQRSPVLSLDDNSLGATPSPPREVPGSFRLSLPLQPASSLDLSVGTSSAETFMGLSGQEGCLTSDNAVDQGRKRSRSPMTVDSDGEENFGGEEPTRFDASEDEPGRAKRRRSVLTNEEDSSREGSVSRQRLHRKRDSRLTTL